jgi:amino acid transporter
MENDETPLVVQEQPSPSSSTPSVTLLQLVTMTFFCVSGGSFGLEDSVRSGYPLATILSLIFVPWVWSLPTALMTAELSTTFPSNGGYVLWTREAFGQFLGFMAGFWGFIYSITDNALYPVMFIDYLSKLTGDISPVGRYFICLLVVLVIAGTNLLGVGLVGKLSIFFLLMVLSPFIILSLWGLPQLSANSLGATPPPGTADWALFLGVILWNTSGWNNIGSVAGSIVNPAKTYPKGLMISLILVIFTYLVPLSVGVSIDTNFASWTVGSYSDVAGQLGGKHFRNYMSFVGMIR